MDSTSMAASDCGTDHNNFQGRRNHLQTAEAAHNLSGTLTAGVIVVAVNRKHGQINVVVRVLKVRKREPAIFHN
jgi:hypothetical protein